MAFSVDSTIQIPARHATGRVEMAQQASSPTVGYEVVARALQTLYANKTHCAVLDWAPTGQLNNISELYEYRTKTRRQDGNITRRHNVWFYVVRGTPEGGGSTWSVRVRNSTSGSSTTQIVNGGAATAGTWWLVGGISSVSETQEYNDWALDVTAATGLAGTDGIYAVAIIDQRNLAALPGRAGGYANGVNPLDLATQTQEHDFASSSHLLDAHVMAVETWRRTCGNELTSAFYTRANGSSHTLQPGTPPPPTNIKELYDRMWIIRPVLSPALVVWFLPQQLVDALVTVTAGGKTWQAAGTKAAGVWGRIDLDLVDAPPLVPIELRFEAAAVWPVVNHTIDSLCMYWDDADYVR
jgi:hypothetical protein